MIEKKTIGHRMINALFVLILIISALSCLLPLLYNLAVSLSSKAAAEAGLVAFWPVDFTVNAYKEIMAERSFFVSFGVAVRRVILALLITLPTLTMASYPLAKSKQEFAPRNVVLWLFVFCMLFSGGTIPWYMVMKGYKLLNSVFAVSYTHLDVYKRQVQGSLICKKFFLHQFISSFVINLFQRLVIVEKGTPDISS